MRNFIRAFNSDFSLKLQRFVYLDGPEQSSEGAKTEVKAEVQSALTPEQLDAKSNADAHEAALKSMQSVKDDPAQLAKAYDEARKTQSALYSGKDKQAIDQGKGDLDKMLTSMGVSGKDTEDIKAQYALAFNEDNLFK